MEVGTVTEPGDYVKPPPMQCPGCGALSHPDTGACAAGCGYQGQQAEAGQPPANGQLQPQPDSPELYAELCGRAAMQIVKFGGDGDGVVNAVNSILMLRGWQGAPRAQYAARIAREAATWTPDQLLLHFRAGEKNHAKLAAKNREDDDDHMIGLRQKQIHVTREASRREDKREQETEAKRNPVTIRSGAWLSEQQFVPVTWAVPQLIPEGVTILGGPPKSGKSWLVLSVALSLAAGDKILGALHDGPERPVLYLALEDSDRRMKDRCAQLGYYAKVPPLFEYITQCHPGRVIDEIASWMAGHKGKSPLVIIDTWGKISMPAAKGESAYDRDYRLGSQLKELAAAEPGAAVLINHHVRKQASADFLDTISGTHGVAGSVDTTLVLERKRHEDVAQLHITGRDVEEQTYQLSGFPLWELEGGSLSGAAIAARAAADRDRLGERSTQILDFLIEQKEATGIEVAKHLGVESEVAGTYLKRLADSGKISKLGRGKWGVLVTCVESVESVENVLSDSTLSTGDTRTAPEPNWRRIYRMGDPKGM